MVRGHLQRFLVDDFETLGRTGIQVVKNAVPNVKELRAKIDEDFVQLMDDYDVENTKLLQQYGAGDWDSAWQCRGATIPIWSRLYQTNRLISSWDGLSIVTPDEQRRDAQDLNEFREPNWMHRDQRVSSYNLADTIQGYLALSDGTEESYSTLFYIPKEGEHAQDVLDEYHAKFHTRYTQSGRIARSSYVEDDYYLFPEEELAWWRAKCILHKPVLAAGDLLLWCSAMPHAAAAAPDCTNVDIARVGIFVAMFPRDFVSLHHLKDRKHLARFGLTSSHNVLNPKLFPFSLSNETRKAKPQRTPEGKAIRDLLI